MFKIGDYVVNGKNGICKIEDIVHLDISMADKEIQYYLLIPEEQKTAKVYIPIDGTNHNIRSLITEKEVWEIIDKIPEIDEMWVDYEKQREQKYREAIQENEPEKLISIIKSMYNRKQQRELQGKRSTAVDDRYFKLAENNLYAELAFALGKDKNEMEQLITDRIEQIK